jgi:energy-converting hydrogenase A subunit M
MNIGSILILLMYVFQEDIVQKLTKLLPIDCVAPASKLVHAAFNSSTRESVDVTVAQACKPVIAAPVLNKLPSLRPI